ncbi:uncharacterized protein LOC127239235 [Andrographis paniculata]|uniref:uncharacterized protein LOC127239235 n=1 Tax=Andrographis paniculata TaxID=175694 RepID=UPI0021E95694|nr:uncharacterized protein LOC127239235 [Andrographis paniculata]
MAIEKNSFKVARFDSEFQSPHSRDKVMTSDDDDEFQKRNSTSAVESDDDDDEFDDCDSGAGSDDFDLLELGQSGEEFCQIGDQTCSIPYELYDLSGLKDVLSMEVWNEVLSEEERFSLSKYLPDMDQENYVRTLKELFSGDNLHFGSPVDKLFEMLKGGMSEPRVALYKQGLGFFQIREHYHSLRKYQNTMVSNLCQMRDAWQNCKGYSIEEKLRVFNIVKSQKSLMNENMEEFRTESSDREESTDAHWSKRVKDRKLGQKTGRYSGYSIGPPSDISSQGRKNGKESTKPGKRNPKGTLKLVGSKANAMKELSEPYPLNHPGVEIKSGRYSLGLPVSRYSKESVNDSPAARMADQIQEDDEADKAYEVTMQRDQNLSRAGVNDKPATSKWKKHGSPRTEDDMDGFMGIPISARNNLHGLGRNKTINKLSDIKVLTTKPSNMRNMYDGGKKGKYGENLQQFTGDSQIKFGKGQKANLSLKGKQIEHFDSSDPAWLGKYGGLFPSDLSSKSSELNAKNKKGKMSRETVDLSTNDKLSHAKQRDMFQASSGNRGIRSPSRNEDTESDSSEYVDEDEDDNPLMRSKWAYPGGVPDVKFGPDTKKAEGSRRKKKNSYLTLDGSSQLSRKMDDFSENLELMKAEQKGKMHDVGYSNILPTKGLDDHFYPVPGEVIGAEDRQHFYPSGLNSHLEGNNTDTYYLPSLKPSLAVGRRRKGEVSRDFALAQPNYMDSNNFDDDLYWTQRLAADNGVPFKLRKKDQMVELSGGYHVERSDVPMIECSNLSRKWKVKNESGYMDLQNDNEYHCAEAELQLDDISSVRKRGKRRLEDASNVLENGVSQAPIVEKGMDDVEIETKRQKKSFPLITPTVHTGFSFSIIHLLSAVRMAMITPLPDDSLEVAKHPTVTDSSQGVKEEQTSKQEDAKNGNSNSDIQANASMSAQEHVPSLSILEIVNRVRSNPGDPCILETQEPLQDLVRGVLKIFSSRTAPLGAKGWKPLVLYEKSSKSWSWVGPVSHNLSDSEVVEEVTSPDVWGLPHKMLVKLVDSFANWLKNSQETLLQIGSLPAPPLTLTQVNLDERERFKDLRAQKSLSTIGQSSEEVREYFRKEEYLRYLIPDRAFSYTAIDGKKSIVAPLRRCGGKPTSKARDHFMLKRNRPPHVTILCLVRDAAARLPGSIGTRADVCTLIRDSQFIMENVSDAQVNQVVSGALDRLHYERDPCVQFDGERKLWVYLHRDREEEDFEDDGTSSTKKWRRQKKEAAEPSEPGDVTVAFPGPLEQSGFDLGSDLNVEASGVDEDKRQEPDYQNGNDQVEVVETSHGSDQGMHPGSTPMTWNGFELRTSEENRLLCQENSTNEEFDEDAYGGGEPPA